RDSPNASQNSVLAQAVLAQLPTTNNGLPVYAVPFLYVVGEVFADKDALKDPHPVVITGTDLDSLRLVAPAWKFEVHTPLRMNDESCLVGAHVAEQLHPQNGHLSAGAKILLRFGTQTQVCDVANVFSAGGAEDDQVLINLSTVQRLVSLSSRISLVQLSIPGTPVEIQSCVASLRQRLPDVDVRPIRQFTEGEAKIYDRISGILSATVGLVLVLTGLCVMAAMTNVAMERRNDVGLMKAIGGATRRVLRLFLAEAAILGLTGGVLGAAIGILLSMWLGKAVFGVAAQPRLIVYPVAVALTIVVAIASAYPLRRLANIRPASVFRGEA
ncbi:MAG TPA: FtsX-like permease family protein, partial [Pyrinomonadaceae bacterium]|nr:FtsX-like permease family protein [Pyrinomonadaceae bacterium]